MVIDSDDEGGLNHLTGDTGTVRVGGRRDKPEAGDEDPENLTTDGGVLRIDPTTVGTLDGGIAADAIARVGFEDTRLSAKNEDAAGRGGAAGDPDGDGYPVARGKVARGLEDDGLLLALIGDGEDGSGLAVENDFNTIQDERQAAEAEEIGGYYPA